MNRAPLIAAGLVLCVAAGCASAGGGSATTGTRTSAAATSRAPNVTPPSTPDPVRVFSLALRSLYQAPTVEYVVVSTVDLGGNGIRTERTVTVDGDKGVAATRLRITADVPGQAKTDLTMRIISTEDTAYVTMPDWTGPRRGKWLQMTSDSAQSMGVPLELSAPTTVPAGVEAFVAKELTEAGDIEGSVDAVPAFSLLGLSGVFKDPDLASSLIGSVPSSVTFDPTSGSIASFKVTGEGHDVETTSESLPPGTIEDLISLAEATVTIKQIGKPVEIELPARDDILTS